MSLEDAFWHELTEIARARNVPIGKLITEINKQKRGDNLYSAIRLSVLSHLRARHAVEADET